jgi:hypothetical protein
LLHNRSEPHNWLQVKLVGTRSNRDAIGARITLTAGGITQTREVYAGSGYLSSSSLVQHFGLGNADHVDTVHVRWPSGAETDLKELTVNRRIEIREN